MGKFYFKKSRAEMHRKPGQRIVKGKLKNKKTVFKLKDRKK